MTDKVQKIREEVERRMKAASKIEEDYKDIDEKLSKKAQLKSIEYHSMLMFIDSMQEELVSDDLEEEISRCILDEDMNFDSCARHFANWQKAKDESTTEDLGEYINELFKQFPEVSFAKLSRIAVRVAKWQKEKDAILPKVWNRENLDDFSYQTAYDLSNDWAKETPTWHDVEMACKLGAKWQKENLWKSAEGTDLPIFDREVIALIDNGKVVFAHRPDPKGWDAKSIITEKIEHYTPETYGKGGWNIPNVKWWLDVDKLPKED